MPTSVFEAIRELPARRQNIVAGWVLNYISPGPGQERILPWTNKKNAHATLRRIAAVLYYLGNRDLFQDEIARYPPLRELDNCVIADYRALPGAWRGSQWEASTLSRFQRVAEWVFSQARPTGAMAEIGTSRTGSNAPGDTKRGDYDMMLLELVAFLYAFKDLGLEEQTPLLTNNMIYHILNQCGFQGGAPFTFYLHGKYEYGGEYHQYHRDRAFKRNIKDRSGKVLHLWSPETENHVLMIYTWNYLTSNWLMWQGCLPDRHPRGDPRVRALLASKEVGAWLGQRYSGWLDRMLQIVGRVVHNGLFETNARPYQQFSLMALLILAAYAESVTPFDQPGSAPVLPAGKPLPHFIGDQQRVAQGAKNAVYYLATKFAFQSFEGKRSPPMRRERDKERRVAFYHSDNVSDIFGVLSGGYVFDDRLDDPNMTTLQKELELRYFYRRIDQSAYALWAAFTGFELPHAIHDFMLNKRGGFFARMQARYARGHYERPNTSSSEVRSPFYFRNGSAQAGGGWRGSPELYFCTDDFMLSAGGLFQDYYEHEGHAGDIRENLENYHFWSKPTMVITKGDIGGRKWWHGNGEDEERDSVNVEAMSDDILFMLGNRRGKRKYGKSQNVWVYKNFAYGYERREHMAPKEYARGWPQRYPKAWDKEPYAEFKTDPEDAATFRVFDFTASASHPLSGYFLIMAKLWKMKTDTARQVDRKHGPFRRGFIEIVPGWMFGNDLSRLVHTVRTMNRRHGAFPRSDTQKPYIYVTATGAERLTLHHKIGHGDCHQGILKIELRDSSGEFRENVPLDRFLFDRRSESAMKDIPLITVWGIGLALGIGDIAGFEKSNTRYVKTGREHGRIIIQNPFVDATVEIDSSDYSKPSCTITQPDELGWLSVLLGAVMC